MLTHLLDTNIVIYALKRKPLEVRRRLNQHNGRVAISSVTAMELYSGAYGSNEPARTLTAVEGFLVRLANLAFDNSAARHAGEISATLKAQGEMIGPYDAMIAGHARALGLVLVSNNIGEFERVPGLQLENWAA